MHNDVPSAFYRSSGKFRAYEKKLFGNLWCFQFLTRFLHYYHMYNHMVRLEAIQNVSNLSTHWSNGVICPHIESKKLFFALSSQNGPIFSWSVNLKMTAKIVQNCYIDKYKKEFLSNMGWPIKNCSSLLTIQVNVLKSFASASYEPCHGKYHQHLGQL